MVEAWVEETILLIAHKARHREGIFKYRSTPLSGGTRRVFDMYDMESRRVFSMYDMKAINRRRE